MSFYNFYLFAQYLIYLKVKRDLHTEKPWVPISVWFGYFGEAFVSRDQMGFPSHLRGRFSTLVYRQSERQAN
jgi:hypothetical protein